MTPLFSVQRNKQYREIYAQLFYDPSLSKTNISKGKKEFIEILRNLRPHPVKLELNDQTNCVA
jgi:hypothetical protein